MASVNPTGRVNYEPNSWNGGQGGPPEAPAVGFETYPEVMRGPKRRLRPESFADHFSQAKQVFDSQTPIEQKHICDAFTFELSKCDVPEIRMRMVANLRHVDEDLAGRVADGLGLDLPAAVEAARPRVEGLAPSPALSIVQNGPGEFRGRKLGVLACDGFADDLLDELVAAAGALDSMVEVVAPMVGGVIGASGAVVPVDQKVGGGPSVL